MSWWMWDITDWIKDYAIIIFKDYAIIIFGGTVILALFVGAICGLLENPRKHW